MEALFIIFNLPTAFILGHYMGEDWILLPPVILYIVSPLLDKLIQVFLPSINNYNFYKSEKSKVIVDKALRLYPFIQLMICLYVLSEFKNASFSDLQFWLTAISFGIVCGGTGLMIGHELMHQKDKVSKVGALILTVLAGYTHWIIEHIQGHHKNVGTLDDPCTARKNETLYQFILRSIPAQIMSAARINNKKFKKLKLIELGFISIVFFLFNIQGLVFVLIQSLVAAILLENVNYIEHYGLIRKKKASGRYSKITTMHSWDNHSIIANVALLNLGFHSDHHANVLRRFFDLQPSEENIINYGIPAQMLVSLVPSIWFHVMNPKLEKRLREIDYLSSQGIFA